MRYFRAELNPDSIHTQEVFEKLAGKSLENLASPTGFELQTRKNTDGSEESDVIDIFDLKKVAR